MKFVSIGSSLYVLFHIALIHLLIYCSSADTDSYLVDTDTSDTQLNCVVDINAYDVRCGKSEEPNYNNDNNEAPIKIVPNVLGIGPSKTGSTALFDMLSHHKNFVVGNANAGGVMRCCGAELYFFYRDNWPMYRQGLSSYSKFYLINNKKVVGAGEKTPIYSSDTLVPYRARSLLSGDTKLIFTVRPPLETDTSLYMYRNYFGKFKADYYEFLLPRVTTFNNWMACRETHFKSMFIPTYNKSDDNSQNLKLRDIHDSSLFDWRTSNMIEHYLHRKCGDGSQISFFLKNDVFQEHLHQINFRRWLHVFGYDTSLNGNSVDSNGNHYKTNYDNILCIHQEDYAANPSLIQQKVSDLLGLSGEGWTVNYTTPHISQTRNHDRIKSTTAADYVVRAFDLFNETISKYLDEVDNQWFNRLCPRFTV